MNINLKCKKELFEIKPNKQRKGKRINVHVFTKTTNIKMKNNQKQKITVW